MDMFIVDKRKLHVGFVLFTHKIINYYQVYKVIPKLRIKILSLDD